MPIGLPELTPDPNPIRNSVPGETVTSAPAGTAVGTGDRQGPVEDAAPRR